MKLLLSLAFLHITEFSLFYWILFILLDFFFILLNFLYIIEIFLYYWIFFLYYWIFFFILLDFFLYYCILFILLYFFILLPMEFILLYFFYTVAHGMPCVVSDLRGSVQEKEVCIGIVTQIDLLTHITKSEAMPEKLKNLSIDGPQEPSQLTNHD